MKKIIRKPASKKIAKIETKVSPGTVVKKPLNKAKLVLIILLLILAGGFLAYEKYWSVATVNGMSVSRIEYIRSMEKQVGKQTLDQMVTEALILGEASKKGVKIGQDIINSEITKIEEKLKAQSQTLEAALKAEGMTRADLEKQIRLQKIVEQLASPNKQITDAEIADFLVKNKDQLPKTATKQELSDLARSQLESQNKNEAINTWLANLKKDAKIIYK